MCLPVQSPPAYRLPHPLQGRITGSRKEAGEDLLLPARRLSRPKGKAKERKADMRMASNTLGVLAVHDLRFVRMDCQPTIRQSRCNGLHHILRLLPAAAVNHRIIRISGKWTLTDALHPAIERIMHEQIHQDRTDHTPLRCATLTRHADAVRYLKRGCQPSLDIQQDPVFPDVG